VTSAPSFSSVRRSLTGRLDSGPVLAIASGSFAASCAMNFWFPFLPLYMRELGATSDANALFWVSIAMTGQGIARFVAGPVWGVLSDRHGRKLMYIRALFFATVTSLIMVAATQPWHIALALTCQGLFSGFIPAAVALTSVTVPESKLGKGLGTVTAAQYLGSTVGPSLGAVLAVGFGMWGAILASALLPALGAALVWFIVPRDTIAPAPKAATAAQDQQARYRSLITIRFAVPILICFVVYATGSMVRLMAPLSLAGFTSEAATGAVGVAFTVAGVASVLGVVAVRRLSKPHWFRWLIAGGMAVSALAHVLLAVSPGIAAYVAFFALTALLQAALLPASNTLIAMSVSRDQRGTAFGIAASAQAISFMVGPAAAAAFAAVSLTLGYLILATLFVVVAVFTLLTLRVNRAG
jgi:DHA1 family multidrug resistance protein-like MFS transporter